MEFSNNNEVMKYLEQHAEQFNQLVKEALNRNLGGSTNDFPPIFNAEKMLEKLSKGAEVDTEKLVATQMAFMEKQLALWQNATKALSGEEFDEVISEARSDRRFKDKDWSNNPVYNYLKQSYLLNSQLMEELADALQFEDNSTAKQLKFYTRQYINTVSPSNYVLTNPEVCRQIIETKGQNLVKGMENFVHDLEHSPTEALKITQNDDSAFSLGENLAYTPGKVVFQNDLFQLLQYSPSSDQVYQRPLLIVPPFINKYYILDLTEEQSLIKWIVDQGYTVFCISWVNPDASLAHYDLTDYAKLGIIQAVETALAITGEDSLNAVGYCVGGTSLAVTQAYMRAQGDKRINSTTFLTTLMDFSVAGEVKNYLSEDTLPLLEQNARNKGVFDGRILATAFSMLRENSLFWSYFIKNYLKGEDPAPFDILYWNSDSTNLTPECFCQYIETAYIGNKLIEAGAFSIDDTPIDLSQIDSPTYFLSTIADHIVPWQSSYQGTQLITGDSRFVLAGSGHIAGVINSVAKGKYPHWINEQSPATAEEWFEGAEENSGSWWPDWHNWLSQLSGEQVSARQPGSEQFPPLEDAPGSYVRVRID